MLSSSPGIQSPQVTAACEKLVGLAWPQGYRPKWWCPCLCKSLHILSCPARAHLLVEVPWLCGHCIYI